MKRLETELPIPQEGFRMGLGASNIFSTGLVEQSFSRLRVNRHFRIHIITLAYIQEYIRGMRGRFCGTYFGQRHVQRLF